MIWTTETGLIYQTLGYLYVEKYDLSRKPDFAAAEAPADEAAETPENVPETGTEEKRPLSPEEEWEAGVKKAEAFILKSVEYDDEDPICLDNLGQFIYRVKGNREEARQWFDKAISQKEGQIDTLWFLSRYDLDNGDRLDLSDARLPVRGEI